MYLHRFFLFFIVVNKTVIKNGGGHDACDGESLTDILQSMSRSSCDMLLLFDDSDSYLNEARMKKG